MFEFFEDDIDSINEAREDCIDEAKALLSIGHTEAYANAVITMIRELSEEEGLEKVMKVLDGKYCLDESHFHAISCFGDWEWFYKKHLKTAEDFCDYDNDNSDRDYYYYRMNKYA